MNEEENQVTETTEDNGVLRTLRSKVEKYEQQEKEWAKERSEAAQQALINAGYPKLVDVFLNSSEGFPTQERVVGFLEGLGLEPRAEAANVEAEPTQSTEPSASSLGQRVATAASNPQATPSFDDDLAAARTPDEIAAVMRQHGLAV